MSASASTSFNSDADLSAAGNTVSSSPPTSHEEGPHATNAPAAGQRRPSGSSRTLKKMLSRLGAGSGRKRSPSASQASSSGSPTTAAMPSPPMPTSAPASAGITPASAAASMSSSSVLHQSHDLNGSTTLSSPVCSPLGISGLQNQQQQRQQQQHPSQGFEVDDPNVMVNSSASLPSPSFGKRPRAMSKHQRHSPAKENSGVFPNAQDASRLRSGHPADAQGANSNSDSMTTRFLRRVSSAPNTKALFNVFNSSASHEPMPPNASHQLEHYANGPPSATTDSFPAGGGSTPSTIASGSSQLHNSTGSSSVYTDEHGVSKHHFPSPSTTPRSKTSPSLSKMLFPSTSPTASTAANGTLMPPSPTQDALPPSPSSSSSPRSQFRRTYSANSIKVKHVEVRPSSFSKIKLLGKGDVGKVYLVKEKKSDKLFAMKGMHRFCLL